MRLPYPNNHLVSFILAAASAVAVKTSAQVVEPPRGFTFRVAENYIATEIEAEKETRTSRSGLSTTIDRLYIAPVLGLGANGSIYHPNLASYDMQLEGGYGWQSLKGGSGHVSTIDQSQSSELIRYNANLRFLQNKPYATSFNAQKSRTFRDVDFFNRVQADMETYSGRVGYTTGPVPVTLAVRHLEEILTDDFQTTRQDQDTLELRARNERERGTTDFSYYAGLYSRSSAGFFEDNGTYHYATLFDTERFGAMENRVLNSTFNFNHVDSDNSPSTTFTASENFNVEHTPNLSSFYDYNFNAYTSGPVDNNSHFGRAGLRHQLFESLNTMADVHADLLETVTPGSTFTVMRYGAGLNESYTKRLSDWGRLSIANGIRLDQEERQSVGAFLEVVNESHSLNDERVAFLRQPRVLIVSRVTDPSGTTNYTRGIDYEIFRRGELSEIRRVVTSTRLPNGSTVLVNYSAEASPSGSFTTLSDQFSVRLDLFENILGIYSRLAWVENSAASQFVVENTFNTQSGVDVSWRFLRAGAEYETRESNLIAYDSKNLFQSFFFEPGEKSSLNLDFRQRWTTYSDDRDLASYSAVLRYHYQFTGYLYSKIEGGYRIEEGSLYNQQLATARTELGFALGKLRMTLGYEFNNSDVQSELRERHFVYFQAKRRF